MTPIATAVWILNMLSDAVGQLAFKAAAISGGDAEGLKHWLNMAKNRWIWLGLLAYGVEIVTWLAFLSMVPLSLAVLLGSMNIMFVMIGGRLCFGEQLTKRRLLAVSLVAFGVALVGWSGGGG